ncbi:MAG TPA: Kdo hydroxylase family protein [Bryobacteraceae bacterium]|nr:Kdo hydroxylase family protein [Bryobacteraceae bacterium]
MPAVEVAERIDFHQVLEAGQVLVWPDAPVGLSEEECDLMRNIRQSSRHHKNISYKPRQDKLCGLDKVPAATRERVRAILRRYSEAATGFAASLLPRYRSAWRTDYASLRTIEEAGRTLPFKKRNDLLHTDAFPTRPTGGGLILRIFYNFHAWRPRVWVTSDPFEVLAARYAAAAGLARIAARGCLQNLARRLRLPFARRPAYDEFMLTFHDYLKRSTEFQSNCPKCRLEFPPGSAWMVFTDVVPHAVEAGQFALEQTLIVPREALASPERAPIAILERLAGRSLA